MMGARRETVAMDASGIRRYRMRWRVLQPFNSAQFSAAVYLSVACIFIAIPKTNSVGARPLISDANGSRGERTERRPNSAGYCGGIGGLIIGEKMKIDRRDFCEKSPGKERGSRWVLGTLFCRQRFIIPD